MLGVATAIFNSLIGGEEEGTAGPLTPEVEAGGSVEIVEGVWGGAKLPILKFGLNILSTIQNYPSKAFFKSRSTASSICFATQPPLILPLEREIGRSSRLPAHTSLTNIRKFGTNVVYLCFASFGTYP